ncbi:enoyl-CoA hydratase/isomerase family protein [Pseudonocardia yunnanensis]|uniref:Enoyl-CoA hydratase/isomerase family protein n=1 Tax=Pseudonocardia yunnanensis TaxID=58107 RepID=A0ABW4F835_9PSEU
MTISNPPQDVVDVPLVLLEFLSDGVARITLNRPEKRNAMSRQARKELIEALDRCRGAARVIVLTGAGPAFCAGVDLKEVDAAGPAQNALDGDHPWIAVQETIRRHPAIVIAAVNGFALGGGVTLINSADLALASASAEIGMPEIGFGLYPGLAGPSTQLRLGPKRAAWMVLTGRRISGRTAQEWGLVNLAVDPAELQDEALALAVDIAQHDAVTLTWCKKALWEVPMHITDWTAALEYGENVGTQIRSRTSAVGDGLSAFAQGRRNPGQGAGGGRHG